MGRKAKMKQQRRPDALHVLRGQAETGDAEAQFQLAARYFSGDGVPQDYAKSTHWFIKAAEQGHVKAQYFLGAWYAQGEGVPQDYETAVYWYTRAAEQGHIQSQCLLGGCYMKGFGGCGFFFVVPGHFDESPAKNQGIRDHFGSVILTETFL